MKTVWKYKIPTDDVFVLDLPIGAKPLSVQVQNDDPILWCLVDDRQMVNEKRRFRLAGTGHSISENNLAFIGTFQLFGGSFVGHLFEII